MRNDKKICRVCGVEYRACSQAANGIFRYRDVACSPECGAEYLRRVEASRCKEPVVGAVEDVPADVDLEER